MFTRRNVPGAPNRSLAAWLAAGGAVLATLLIPAAGSSQESEPAGDDDAVLRQQLEAVRRATGRYRDHDVAVAEGFELFGGDGALMGEHWYHWLTEWRIRRGRLGPADGRTELTMVHAWVWVENPLGVFAQDHFGLPYLRLGLPAEWAEGIDRETAMGVALAADGQCEQQARRVRFLAGADRRQLQGLLQACRAASERVGAVVEQGPGDADRLNRTARRAWLDYVEARQATLTAEQRGRLEVAIEHPEGHGSGHGGH